MLCGGFDEEAVYELFTHVNVTHVNNTGELTGWPAKHRWGSFISVEWRVMKWICQGFPNESQYSFISKSVTT